MEAKRSRLLTTARPYLQVLSIFCLIPPAEFFSRTLRKRRRICWIAGYSLYLVASVLMVFYECHANIVSLQLEIHKFHVEDFSKVIVAIATCNQLNILLNYGRLGLIYNEIANLDLEIGKASKDFCGKRHWWSFRLRLAISIGLWMVFIIGVIPRLTLGRTGPFFHWLNQVFTQIILIMLQLKGPEYCLFVLLVYELILRTRHVLEQLKADLEDFDCGARIQELCVTLKQNQLLIGRIWRLVGEIGAYFRWSMTLLFLYNGLTILHVVNWAIIRSINPNDCCQLSELYCVKTYNSISHILHQIGCLPTAEEFQMLKMGLKEYILQMQHLKLLFTCGGLFDINLKLFGGMLVTLCGYVIIIVQFKIQDFAQISYRQNTSNTF
ncbi:putative gustatory receptor 98c isoform X2 [Drosophila sechellia]|uniref:putative gustatory receptor 98c isoform X2 n=1 Tax=Drosophila sechellia TaxID=7238 RepID=UPI0013DE71C3|nr:putative gustatory receptor 98c isoform X2 [Drosophila sechellia]